MKWFCIMFCLLVIAVIAGKLRAESKKRSALLHGVRSLSLYLNKVENNPFLNEKIANQAACFLQCLHSSGYVKSQTAKISENKSIEYEMRIVVPKDKVDVLSTAIFCSESPEEKYKACFQIVDTLTTNKASLIQELVGKQFLYDFISSLVPVFNMIDEAGREYAYTRILPIPDEEDEIFKECCAVAQRAMEKEQDEQTFNEWIEQHKNVCILSVCSFLAATVAAICIHFSDSFYVQGISHLRRYISLMGVPTGVNFQTGTVIISILGVLFTGISVALFAICMNVALRPEDDLSHIGKVTLKKYLPLVASLMLCVSLHLSLSFYSGNMVWLNLLDEDAMNYIELFSEISSPLLIWLCVTWSLVFVLGDILGDDSKWLSILALAVVCIIGLTAICILIYENVCQLWYLIPHIGTVISFTAASGVWAVI